MFTTEILETSYELTKKQRVLIKNTTGARKLDSEVDADDSIIIRPDFWAILKVHNDESADKDYIQYIIVDKDGTKYLTGSKSFWASYSEIYKEMEGEDFDLRVFKLPSKNFQGRYFLTCDIV